MNDLQNGRPDRSDLIMIMNDNIRQKKYPNIPIGGSCRFNV